MRLILVRHGETTENKQHILQGKTHGKLTEKSVSQTKELADYLTSIEICICFTSDLQRTIDTASIIVSKHPGMKLINYQSLILLKHWHFSGFNPLFNPKSKNPCNHILRFSWKIQPPLPPLVHFKLPP